MSGAKMTRYTRIAVLDGHRPIETLWHEGVWACHAGWRGGGYTVTHIPTGLSMAHRKHECCALAVMAAAAIVAPQWQSAARFASKDVGPKPEWIDGVRLTRCCERPTT